jgi:S-adenosylmethionine:diacylglycerol 3-amino-3-carboxypropyl transferase
VTVSLLRARDRAPPASPAALHAPLFQDLVLGLEETDRHVVLDLGTASTEMLALLGRSRTRAEIVDLAHFGSIERLNTTEPGPDLTAVANTLLPSARPDDGVDLVFCWDLLNYLNLHALSALMEAIARRARPGALAHALIFYAERDMSASPGRYVPTADAELVSLGAPSTTIAAPRYSPEDLARSMGGFQIDRARLLGNGMQEFLFRLD